MALFSKYPDGSFRAFNSVVTGDVILGQDSSVWFNAVIRGDVAPVTIGARVNVQDNAVIHCDSGKPNVIEDDVVIGHGAIVHGVCVGAGSLIGMGAILLGGSRIGRGCLVAAGAVVPPNSVVPDGHVVMGTPGRIVRPVREEEQKYMGHLVPHYVELARKYARGEFEPSLTPAARTATAPEDGPA